MKKRIVVVDDDPVTLKTIERFLKEKGHQTYVADTGTEGYELVVREKPDILISDMLLPGIHGVEICRKIKENLEMSSVKVIMMTAVYKHVTYLHGDMECGRDGFLKKPVDLEELIEVIDKLYSPATLPE